MDIMGEKVRHIPEKTEYLFSLILLRNKELHKKKIGGYSSTFILTNVIGFIPAVISCEIPEHTLAIFILILGVLCLTSVHLLITYILFYLIRPKNLTIHRILTNELAVWTRKELDIYKKYKNSRSNLDIEDLRIITAYIREYEILIDEFTKYGEKDQSILSILVKWVKVEKALQVIAAFISFLIVVLLLHPVSKFSIMDYKKIAQVIFTVWLYFVNVLLLIFHRPSKYGGYLSNSQDANGSHDNHDPRLRYASTTSAKNSTTNGSNTNRNNVNINNSTANSHQRHPIPADSSSQTMIQMASLGEGSSSSPS